MDMHILYDTNAFLPPKGVQNAGDVKQDADMRRFHW